jgi:hypothetical protein
MILSNHHRLMEEFTGLTLDLYPFSDSSYQTCAQNSSSYCALLVSSFLALLANLMLPSP